MKNLLLIICICLPGSQVYAAIRLPAIFGDNMVLQRDQPIPVWGDAEPGERVTVHFHDQEKSARADAKGHWKLTLNRESAGGPFQFTLTGSNTIVLRNVLVGEVWICAGQSNMEFELRQAENGPM